MGQQFKGLQYEYPMTTVRPVNTNIFRDFFADLKMIGSPLMGSA